MSFEYFCNEENYENCIEADCAENRRSDGEWETYYNPKTGKIVALPDDENLYIDDEMYRLAEEIEDRGDFVRLPN